MDEKVTYFNDLLVRLEEIFYHELSGMTHAKVEYVGTDYLKDKDIQGTTVEEVTENCIKVIKAGGLVEDITFTRGGGGILLELSEAGSGIGKAPRRELDPKCVQRVPNFFLLQLGGHATLPKDLKG